MEATIGESGISANDSSKNIPNLQSSNKDDNNKTNKNNNDNNNNNNSSSSSPQYQYQYQPIISLNVGGRIYQTGLDTLTNGSSPVLSAMFSEQFRTSLRKDDQSRPFI